MAYENTGLLAFANSLSNAGQMFGDAMKQRAQYQSLASLGKFAENQDYAGLAKAAFEMGNPDLGIRALAQAQEVKKLADARAAGKEILAPFMGGAAPQGVTGGVTPNPTPQPPMNLPGSPEASLPRGMRNFNPGNIEDGAFARSQPGYVGSDGRFAKFDTMEHGVGAQAGLLGKYGEKGVNTVTAIVNRYAPPSENGKATENYIRFVAGNLGVDANAPLNLADPNIRQKLALTMSQFENGRPVMGGAQRGVQVADASGAVPASAIPGQAPQANPIDALKAKENNLIRFIAAGRANGADEGSIKSLELMLKQTQDEITRAGNDPGRKVTGEAAARRQLVEQQGGNPDDPRNQQFINTGKYPREDAQPLSATDKKAILEADEGVSAAKSAIDALQQAKKLSPNAYGGFGAGARGSLGANLPDAMVPDSLASPEMSQNTQDLDNLVGQNALGQLKAIFGGNPTEGERAIMLELQGASSKSDAVRQKIYDRAIGLAQRRLAFNQSRADELRGGDYYSPKGGKGDSLRKPSAEDIQGVKNALAAGRSKQEVMDFLRANKISPEGLF
jgi:hypothetical protein